MMKLSMLFGLLALTLGLFPASIHAGTMQMNLVTLNAVWSTRQEAGGQVYPKPLTFNRASDGALVTWQAGFVMMWGGGPSHNDVWITSDSGSTWEIISGTGSRHTNNMLQDGSRTGLCANKATGEMFVTGGKFSGIFSSNISYSTNGMDWQMFGSQAFWRRERAPCVVDNTGNLYISGGETHTNNAATAFSSNDIWMTAAASTRGSSGWTMVASNAEWAARQGHNMGSYYSDYLKTNILYMVNGYQTEDRFNDIWVSSDQAKSWQRLNGLASYERRQDSHLTVLKNGILIIAAGDTAEDSNANDVWVSVDGGYKWGQCCEKCSYRVREDHVQIVDSTGRFLLFSGSLQNNNGVDLGNSNDVWRSSLLFNDVNTIARTCGVTVTCGDVGLRCYPGGYCPCSPYGRGVTMNSVNNNPGWVPRFEGGIGQYPKQLVFNHADTGARVTLPANSLVMWGGRTEYGDSTLNDVWATADGSLWYLIGGTANGNGVHARSTGATIQDLARTADCYDSATGRFYSIAGSVGGSGTSTVQTSLDGGLSWRKLADGRFPPREAAACAVDGQSRVFVYGGESVVNGLDEKTYNDVWMSSNLGSSWTRVTAMAPWKSRTQADGDVYTSKALGAEIIYMANGYENNNPPHNRLNDIWVSSNNGAQWARVTANAPYAGRQDSQLLITPSGALVVVAGDVGANLPGNLNDIWSSLDGGYTWGLCNMTAGFSPREDHVAIFTDRGYLLVTQGEAPQTPMDNQVWRSTQSFFSDSTVASLCGLKVPACGVGLRCWPTGSRVCKCQNDEESSTGGGASSNSSPSTSSGLPSGAIAIIVIIVILVVLCVGYYIKKRMLNPAKQLDYQPYDNQMTQILTTDGGSSTQPHSF